MIAEKYGYWISPGPATETANTPVALERIYAAAERASKENRRVYVLLGVFIGLLAGSLVVLIMRNNLGVVLGALISLGVITVSLMATGTRGRRAESPDTKNIVPLLEHHSWQAWPCIVEGQNGNPHSYLKLVYLMSPQQEVVRVFTAAMPTNVWWSLTDGMGVLWVCGDLRYHVVMGSQLGEDVWIASPYQKQVATPMTTQIFHDVASAATSSAVQRLLGG